MEIKILKKGIHANQDIAKKENPHVYLVVEPLCSAVTLIKGEKANIIVDTGNFGFEEEILTNLKKEGLEPKDIDYVILTHTHPDHMLNTYLFKHANLIFNEGISIQGIKGTCYTYATKIKVPYVEIIKTHGHSTNDISVVVRTDKTYVIAGDAIRYGMLENGFKNEQEKESARNILEIADVIIPGHGDIIEGETLQKFKDLLETKPKLIIGYTTGVFDLFHQGHLNLLRNAKEHCDKLMVGVTTDELSVEFKGKKPVIPFEERIDVLKSVKYVDEVVPQTSMDKFEAWEKYKFDVMFASESPTKQWPEVEAEFMKKFEDRKLPAPKIVYLPYTPGVSSTIRREILKK